MDYQIDFAKTNLFVETIFKRKINIKGITDKNFAVRVLLNVKQLMRQWVKF